jgi:sialate O-acetylesterase
LALAARAVAYGQKIHYRAPSYKSMRVRHSKVILSFYDADGGLVAQGGTPTGFAVAGVDQSFYPAQAKVMREEQIEVWSDKVPEPVAVRYGWANCPVVNVASRAGLPMSPFRTDNWPPERPFVTYKLPPSTSPKTPP